MHAGCAAPPRDAAEKRRNIARRVHALRFSRAI